MAILVVGGDSVDAIKQRARARGHSHVEHWSGRKTRDWPSPFRKIQKPWWSCWIW